MSDGLRLLCAYSHHAAGQHLFTIWVSIKMLLRYTCTTSLSVIAPPPIHYIIYAWCQACPPTSHYRLQTIALAVVQADLTCEIMQTSGLAL